MSSTYLKQRGELVTHYRVRRFLGAGMEGHVYLVEDVRNGALRTLKVLRGRNMEAEAAHTAAHYRKLASASTLKRFREWGLLDAQRGVGTKPFLVFDYIQGETLARRIEAGRIGDPLGTLAAVCHALVPIHRRGHAIGDFDRERNLLVERGTGLIRFCDLDAGGPHEPPPTIEDDRQELLRLARRLWRVVGSKPRPELLSAISAAPTAQQLCRALRGMHWPRPP